MTETERENQERKKLLSDNEQKERNNRTVTCFEQSLATYRIQLALIEYMIRKLEKDLKNELYEQLVQEHKTCLKELTVQPYFPSTAKYPTVFLLHGKLYVYFSIDDAYHRSKQKWKTENDCQEPDIVRCRPYTKNLIDIVSCPSDDKNIFMLVCEDFTIIYLDGRGDFVHPVREEYVEKHNGQWIKQTEGKHKTCLVM